MRDLVTSMTVCSFVPGRETSNNRFANKLDSVLTDGDLPQPREESKTGQWHPTYSVDDQRQRDSGR